MADLWVQLSARTGADRETLTRQADLKMLTEDAVGGEILARREPDHVNLRNDTALIYMELGEPAQALRHFEAVTRVEPGSAPAWCTTKGWLSKRWAGTTTPQTDTGKRCSSIRTLDRSQQSRQPAGEGWPAR